MFSIELHGVKFSARTVSDVIALIKGFKASPSLDESGKPHQPCMAHVMSRSGRSEILARLGKVTANAADDAVHAVSAVAESALPLAEYAASLILDKTAMFSECLGDRLYHLAKVSQTTSARYPVSSTANVDGIGPRNPAPQETVFPSNPSDFHH